MQKIKNIDFLKKGSIDFFLTFFTVFSVVQSNIFNDKSHSYLKRNLTVDLVCRDMTMFTFPPSFLTNWCTNMHISFHWFCWQTNFLFAFWSGHDTSIHGFQKKVIDKTNFSGLFRCVLASLYEGLSVCPSVRRSVRRSVRPSVGPSVRPSHTSWISKKWDFWTEFEQNSIRIILLCHLKDN